MLQNKKSKKSVNLHGQSLFSSQIYFQKIKASPSLNKELKKSVNSSSKTIQKVKTGV